METLVKQEYKLCLWCKNLHFEPGYMISEETWDSGELTCKLNLFEVLYADNPFNYSPTLFNILNTAKTCNKFDVRDNLARELTKCPA